MGPSDLLGCFQTREIIYRVFFGITEYELRVAIKFSVGKMMLDSELVIKMAAKGSRSSNVKRACIIRLC